MKLLNYLFFIILTVLFIHGYGAPVQAQSPSSAADDSTQSVVRVIRFVGNENVKDQTLESLIRTQTNREFLGIPRFTPWYFVWKLTGKFGEPPTYLDRQTVSTDLERIKRYYETLGFREAMVDSNIVEFKPGKVEVSYLITEGPRSYIRTMAYSGIPPVGDKNSLSNFFEASRLTGRPLDDTTYTVNSPFLEDALNRERLRIINFLKDNGYAAIQRDSVTVQVKPRKEDPHIYDILYLVEPGDKYTFGDVHISLRGPGESENYVDKDTLTGPPHTTGGKQIYLEKESSTQTRFDLLTDQLLFNPGDIFNNSLYIRSINEFQNLGMLSIREFGLSEDGSLPDYSREDIPVMFSLQTLPKHSINLNLFGMKRYGFGSGAGVTYTNNNLFGKAENLQLGVNGSFEYVNSETLRDIAPDSTTRTFNSTLFKSFETRVDYSLPRLIFPFQSMDDNLFFSNSRTRYSLSISRSNQLLFDINSDIRFNLRYEVQHDERFSSFLDLFELDLLDTDPSPQFRESLKEEYGENSFEYQRILEDFRPQISSILRYTFRSRRTDIIKRDHGYYSEYSVALGGNLPFLVDRYVVTPDTVESNLPPLFRNSQNSLAYSRFIKGTADYRRYIPISDDAVFAYRGFVGIAYPYGKSKTIPLNQRFYAGGSNDIRGWDIYSLGPGGISLDEVTINGGEIKLVGQTEIRQTLFKDFLSANWIGAWFTDAGNIWYGPRTEFPSSGATSGTVSSIRQQELIEQGKFHLDEFYKQIAVGSGLGLRLDWQYVVVRFDFAFRIHDLQQGWFNNKKLYFTFGIGHSF